MREETAQWRHDKLRSILARHAIALMIFTGLYVVFYVATLVNVACFCWLNRGMDSIVLLAGWVVLPMAGAILITKHEGSLYSGIMLAAFFQRVTDAVFLVFEMARLTLRYVFSMMRF